MRKNPKKPQDKPHFCHDENFEFSLLKKHCNQQGMFISAVKLMKYQGAPDLKIIDTCNKQELHIITRNKKDFKLPQEAIKIGIILVSLRKDLNWLSKFKKMFNYYHKHKDYFYKTITIGDRIFIKDRKSGLERIL